MVLELVKEFAKSGSNIPSVDLSPAERSLAVISRSNLCVYDTSSGDQKWSAELDSFQAVFSPGGTRLAVADYSGKCVKIFASETGDLLRTLDGHTSDVWGIAWSSTRTIASSSKDWTVRLWDPESGKCLQTLEGHAGSVFSVAFSPDGTKLASCSKDNTVRIWDVASGTCLHTLNGHTSMVWRVAFSPDGSKLASTSRDGTARIWDSSSDFHCIRILKGAGGSSWPSISWSPDSRILASASGSGFRLWDENGVSIWQEQNQSMTITLSRFSHEIIVGGSHGNVSRWKSPITWSFFLDVKKCIPFGKLYSPSNSPHDVSGTLERISTIVGRMDLPIAFHRSISRLHDLNNPIFIGIEKKTKIASKIEQDFRDLINQRQSLRELHESLQIKAHQHASVHDVNQDLSSVDSLVRSISEAIPIINKHLQVHAAIKPSSDTSSLKQYEHPSPKELSVKELSDILGFTHISSSRLVHLEQLVVDTGVKFEKALLEYDNYAGEIREQSEKNLDALNGFLAHLTRPSIASDRIHEIESTLSKLQVQLDSEKNIMSELAVSLSSLLASNDKLNNLLQVEEGKEQKAKSCIVSGTTNETPADLKTHDDGDSRQQSAVPPDVDGIEYLDQQLRQAKAQLGSAPGFLNNPHLVFKWLKENPNAKLDAAEIFDMMGIR